MKRFLVLITLFSFCLMLSPGAWSTTPPAHKGYVVGAVMKFKMHKDNPTQVPIGTPISLVFIAAALLFLPSILNVTSSTIFGADGGSVSGPEGTIYS